ncbi:MAG TPA: PQQ-binding-like beta-propeller repeat protein [Sedimentisphaerales bacterium]|nr:PQQ-binding-like beta-propeller repeat protein [Sedimentisphaerales bacterium]
MLKVSACRLVLAANLLFVCSGRRCFSEQVGTERLVSPELLQHAGLEVVWHKKLPMREKEQLDRLVVVADRIYALSSENYIVSLNREKGNLIFGRSFGRAGTAVLGLDHYDDKLISIVGNQLVEVNPETGTELSAKRLEFGITCPAARNSSCYYIASTARRLRTYRAEDKVRLYEAAAENDSIITSVIADDNSVVFATDGGNVICAAADKPKKLWEFNASDGIVGAIVRDGDSLFAASKDTYVYKLNMETGTPPVWKYQTDALLDRGPRVTGDVVYQYVRDKGLTAIDKETGRFMWRVDGGIDLLAEGGGKAYVIKSEGELVVMDNSRKKRLYSANFARVSKYAANTVDSKIYIADQTGRIVCLKPVD